MKIEEVITMRDYDRRAPIDWPFRIPDVLSLDLADRLGDCIYDFSTSSPKQRAGVHGPANMRSDLGGANVLVSRDFYYFGSRAIPIPQTLPICPTTQGHRSTKNDPYVVAFEQWIRGLKLETGQLYGWPDVILDWASIDVCGGCLLRADDVEEEV